MAEHKYAQVLRWIADGSLDAVYVRWGRHPSWLSLSERNEIVYDEIVRGQGSYEFRLAPRIITINGREIEAPIDQIKSGDYCYCADSTGDVTAVRFSEEDIKHRYALTKGRLFSTPESAKAAFDAVTSLLLPDGK